MSTVEALEGRARLSQFVVTNLNDNGDGSLRQAIIGSNNTSGPNEIDFATGLSGTITLTSGQLTIANNDVTIEGPGDSVLSVTGNNASRVFEVDQVQVTISGLTITGGNVGSDAGGGGILDNGGTLTIDTSTISGNTAYQGGGISVVSGAATIAGSTISDNTAVAGGGIYCLGDLTLSTVMVTNNLAEGNIGVNGSGGAGQDAQGGGIYSAGGALR